MTDSVLKARDAYGRADEVSDQDVVTVEDMEQSSDQGNANAAMQEAQDKMSGLLRDYSASPAGIAEKLPVESIADEDMAKETNVSHAQPAQVSPSTQGDHMSERFDVATMGERMLSDWAQLKKEKEAAGRQQQEVQGSGDVASYVVGDKKQQQPHPIAQAMPMVRLNVPGSYAKKRTMPALGTSLEELALQNQFIQAIHNRSGGKSQYAGSMVAMHMLKENQKKRTAHVEKHDDTDANAQNLVESFAMAEKTSAPAPKKVVRADDIDGVIHDVVSRLEQVATSKAQLLKDGKYRDATEGLVNVDALDELLRIANKKLAQIKKINFVSQLKDAYQEAVAVASAAEKELARLREVQQKDLELLQQAEKNLQEKQDCVARLREQQDIQVRANEDERKREQEAASLREKDALRQKEIERHAQEARLKAEQAAQRDLEDRLRSEADVRAKREAELRVEREKRLNAQVQDQLKAEQRARQALEAQARDRVEQERLYRVEQERVFHEQEQRLRMERVALRAASLQRVEDSNVRAKTDGVNRPGVDYGDVLAVPEEGVVDGVITALGEGLGGVIGFGSKVAGKAKSLSLKKIISRS